MIGCISTAPVPGICTAILNGCVISNLAAIGQSLYLAIPGLDGSIGITIGKTSDSGNGCASLYEFQRTVSLIQSISVFRHSLLQVDVYRIYCIMTIVISSRGSQKATDIIHQIGISGKAIFHGRGIILVQCPSCCIPSQFLKLLHSQLNHIVAILIAQIINPTLCSSSQRIGGIVYRNSRPVSWSNLRLSGDLRPAIGNIYCQR